MENEIYDNTFYTGRMPVPFPKKYILTEKEFSIAPVISAPQEYVCSAEVLSDYLKRMYEFCTEVKSADAEQGIRLVYDPLLEKESYRVKAADGLVEIKASSVAGFSHGGSTVLQLATLKENVLYIPEYEIEDKPDLEWRGLMVDLARACYPFPEDIMKHADICYYYRMSVLHLHFTDGPATYMFHLPSEHFPRLNARAYSHKDIDFMKKYLADRGITLIPEIEMPGHAEPLTAIYPEVFGENHHGLVCAGKPGVFEALDTLIGEVCELFPDAPYIHIGFDEAQTERWDECPDCRRFMEENGLASGEALYCYMVDKCTRMVMKRGRTPIVWEGFLKDGMENISRNVLVMVFESKYQNARELTEAGFKVINTSWQPLYVCPNEIFWQPWHIYHWKYNRWLYIDSLDDSDAIEVEKTDMILGGQICIWSGATYKRDGASVERNMAALSERVWNRECIVDYKSYANEKKIVSEKLKQMLDKEPTE